jgi:hypothetical protein
LRGEALSAEVALRIQPHRVAKDDVVVSILNAHRDEALAGLLHVAEAYPLTLGPRCRGVAIAILALVLAAARAERAEVALVAALVSNDVLHGNPPQ